MTTRPEYLVLTERADVHHVVIRREGSKWFHRVATFARRDRADDYAECENDYFDVTEEGDSWPADRYEAPEPDPDTPLPPSAIKPENFRPANVREERAVEPKPPSPQKGEGTAGAPTPKPAQIIPEPIQARPHVEPPPKPKPLTDHWDNKREPALARGNGHDAPSIELPKGSPGQQLADQIAADLPELMREHFGGPIWVDLAGRYSAPEARVREAIQYLVSTRRARYAIPDGQREAHLTPLNYEGPEPRRGPPIAVDHDARRKAVLDALRQEADNGVVQMSQPEIARRAGMPAGSLPPLMAEFLKNGTLSLVQPADAKTRTPATYRITEQGA